MFLVDAKGIATIERKPSGYGMDYDLQVAEFDTETTWYLSIQEIIGKTKLIRQAAKEVLLDRGVKIL